jgi:hypothetical protein
VGKRYGAACHQTIGTPILDANELIFGSMVTRGREETAAVARMCRSQGSRCSQAKAAAAQAMGAVTATQVKPSANRSSQISGRSAA